MRRGLGFADMEEEAKETRQFKSLQMREATRGEGGRGGDGNGIGQERWAEVLWPRLGRATTIESSVSQQIKVFRTAP
jgi:hypothetical protein